MKTALYGGTFDPIHHGHLILARQAIEQLSLDRLIFIPAGISPIKLEAQPAPADIRHAMVRAAIADEPHFECDDTEAHRPGPSYTIDTVQAWQQRAPSDQLYYLIGQDNVRDLPKWRHWPELQRLAQFIVFERNTDAPPHDLPRIIRRIDISATEIRKRTTERRSIRYLVPEPVRALIETHGLYR